MNTRQTLIELGVACAPPGSAPFLVFGGADGLARKVSLVAVREAAALAAADADLAATAPDRKNPVEHADGSRCDGAPHRVIERAVAFDGALPAVYREQLLSSLGAPSVRRSYKHKTCKHRTFPSLALAQTAALDPAFYVNYYCAWCEEPYHPASEFTWEDGSQDPEGPLANPLRAPK